MANGFRDAQVQQAISRADQWLRLATNDSAKVLDLTLERIVPHHADHARLELLPPRPVFSPRVRLEAHRGNGQTAVGAGDDVAVFVLIGGVGLVLLARL